MSNNHMKLIRTLSFQTEHILDEINTNGYCTALMKNSMFATKNKENKLKDIFLSKGMSLINDEIPEEYTVSIYHWIALENEINISEASLARSFNELISYYKLRDRVILDLLIPENELVILGHPDDNDIKEQGVKGYYTSLKVEGVTRYIKKEWIQGVYMYDLDGIRDGRLTLKVKAYDNACAILSKNITFNYSQAYIDYGFKEDIRDEFEAS